MFVLENTACLSTSVKMFLFNVFNLEENIYSIFVCLGVFLKVFNLLNLGR